MRYFEGNGAKIKISDGTLTNGGGVPTTPNSTPREFTFNGAAVVPEAGSLALLLPALGALAVGVVVTRKRNA